jgi:MGT family glycosyltransferase
LARFLFTVWPFAGHVHPGIGIAHALRARGHEVAFYTGTAAGSVVVGEGFRYFPFTKLDEKRVSDLVSSEFPYRASMWLQLRYAKQLQARLREWLLDTIPQQVEDIGAVLATWRPDVIVCDSAFWSPILVFHETQRIPVAVLSVTAACILPGPDAPAWGRGSPRPRNGVMRARYTLERKLVMVLSAGFRARVNALRRTYGLPVLDCPVTEFAARMLLYLVPSAREYDYNRRDLPPSVHYVGPCLWDKPAIAAPPDWLAQLTRDRPLIYVTEATVGTSEPFLLRAAARALADLPFQVVMTSGKQRDPAQLDLGVLAPNIRVESYVPQSDLLPRTAIMVTLGGSGGVLAALKAGVPLVVVPTEWDRPENAQRVVEYGAGLRIAAGKCTPERLRAAVNRVMTEPSFRKNARRLAHVFARHEGPARAAQLLEQLSGRTASDTGLRQGLQLAAPK